MTEEEIIKYLLTTYFNKTANKTNIEFLNIGCKLVLIDFLLNSMHDAIF